MHECKYCKKPIFDDEEMCLDCELEAQEIVDTDEEIILINNKYASWNLCFLSFTVLLGIALLITHIALEYNWGILFSLIMLVITIIFILLVPVCILFKEKFKKRILKKVDKIMLSRHS